MVKWLAEISVAPEESQNFYHFHDNRVLPPGVDQEKAKAEGALFTQNMPAERRHKSHCCIKHPCLLCCWLWDKDCPGWDTRHEALEWRGCISYHSRTRVLLNCKQCIVWRKCSV